MRKDYLSAKRFFWLECSIFFTALCALWKPLSGVADGNDPPVLTADSFLAPLGDVKCGVFTNAPLPTGAASFSNGISYLPPSGDLPMGIYTNAYPFDVPSYTLSDGWDRDCYWWYGLGVVENGAAQNDLRRLRAGRRSGSPARRRSRWILGVCWRATTRKRFSRCSPPLLRRTTCLRSRSGR